MFILWCLLSLIFVCILPILITAIFYKLRFEFPHRSCISNARLNGKTALVTGGNSGIGYETALDLAGRGAKVIIASRDVKKSNKAIDAIKTKTGNQDVHFMPLDLSKLDSVREFAAKFDKEYDNLHILVNNAGIGLTPKKLTEHGIDIIMQVNYFGHFLLTTLLLHKLNASKPSRIVINSSVLHFCARLDVNDLRCLKTDSSFFRYNNSKLCEVLWAKAMAKRLPEGVTINALHPGLVKTDIFNTFHFLIREPLLIVIDLMFRTAKQGAQTVIHLCVAEEVENVSGKFFYECEADWYSSKADNDSLVELVYKKSCEITGSLGV